MAKSRLRLVDTDHGYKQLMRNAGRSRLARQLSVGVVTDDSEVAIAALAAEYGLGTQPMRSFLRSWFDRNTRRLERDMRVIGLAMLKGDDRQVALASLGSVYVKEIQEQILSSIPPELEPETIAEKEREDAPFPEIPLVRTGALLRAIVAMIDGATVTS